jgi:indole-3-glycerol phosphate synthase
VSGVVDARYLNGIGDVVLVRRHVDGDNRYVAMATLDAMSDGKIATSKDEREANARLISAAPDMLAALTKCHELFALIAERKPVHSSKMLAAHDKAVAAIAKASGK